MPYLGQGCWATQIERVLRPYEPSVTAASLSAPPFSLTGSEIAQADAERRAAAQRHRTSSQARPGPRSSTYPTPCLGRSNVRLHRQNAIDITVLLHHTQVTIVPHG